MRILRITSNKSPGAHTDNSPASQNLIALRAMGPKSCWLKTLEMSQNLVFYHKYHGYTTRLKYACAFWGKKL